MQISIRVNSRFYVHQWESACNPTSTAYNDNKISEFMSQLTIENNISTPEILSRKKRRVKA